MSVILNRSSEQEDKRLFDETLCLAGLSGEEQLMLHFKKDVLAALKGKLTARDLIGTMNGLIEIAADLAAQLAIASRKDSSEEPCSCSGKCDYEATCELSIPPCLLAEAGIPLDRPLLAYVEDGSIVIKGEEELFPAEVTGELLRILENAEVDAEGLATLLKGERIIYGD